MSRRMLAVLAIGSMACAAGAGDPALRVVDDFSGSDAAARAAWEPMTGSPSVSVVSLEGRRALRLACTFRGTRIDRASWDRAVRLDMTACEGLRFLMHCPNAEPVGHFTIYFRSGKGWYAAGVPAPAPTGWTEVHIRKSATKIEGVPAGWGRVDRIRISAWRGKDEDTVFHVAELGLFGRGGRIAVVRGDSAGGESRGAAQYAGVFAGLLDQAALPYALLGEGDLAAERLKGVKLVVLPYNPSLPAEAADVLAEFCRGGGKLLACYVLPRKLLAAAGMRPGRHVRQEYRGHFASIRPSERPLAGAPAEAGQASWNISDVRPADGRARVAAWWFNDKGESTGLPAVVASDSAVFLTHVLLPDDRTHKQQLVLAMLGHLLPDAWRLAADGRIAAIGRFGPYDGHDDAAEGIRKLAAAAGHPAAAALDRASAEAERARTLREQGLYPQAIAAAGAAGRALVEAYCASQESPAAEHRAFWCHSALGVAGMTWDEAIGLLADNGFTAILPNMLWADGAFYDSEVLPVAPEVRQAGDQLALCLAACRKHGVACHVWKVNFRMSGRASKDFPARMRAAGRTQVRYDGTPEPRWLCPSHPDNRKLEIDSMVEVARRYAVAGLHFDYIRYPGGDGCFCKGCRQRFEQTVGKTVADWPAAVRRDERLRQQWLDFRRRQVTAVVAGVAEQARKVRPGVKLSAAVFGNWPVDRDGVGQDWKLWCDRGYLDFVCPMDYTPDDGQFARQVTRQLAWAGKVPCYPGIGLSTWPDPTDAVKAIAQIRITRRLGTGGFTIFNYAQTEAREVLPLLGSGITRRTPAPR